MWEIVVPFRVMKMQETPHGSAKEGLLPDATLQ